MNSRILETAETVGVAAAKTVADHAAGMLESASHAGAAAREALASEAGAELSFARKPIMEPEPSVRVKPAGMGAEAGITTNLPKPEPALSVPANSEASISIQPAIDAADPRTYAAAFKNGSAKQRSFGAEESIAAIVRNASHGDPSQLESGLSVRSAFGSPTEGIEAVQRTREYLEQATGLRLSDQAARFRADQVEPGHYAVFAKGFNGIDRVVYGRVNGPRDSFLFDPLKGKELTYDQVSQFKRRVLYAHRLETPEEAEASRIQDESSKRSELAAPNLINPPDERGGISRINGFQGVAALLRNDISEGKLFENARDIEEKFGHTKIARSLDARQSRLFGRHYLQMATGAHLGKATFLPDALESPGRYALFFDSDSKMLQAAFGKVEADGKNFFYNPRLDREMTASDLAPRNPYVYKVEPHSRLPESVSFKKEALNLSPLDQFPHEAGSTINFDGTVDNLLPFHRGLLNPMLKQNFVVETESGQRIRILHNAENDRGIIPLSVGSQVNVLGEFVKDQDGYALMHWTHRGKTNEAGEFVNGWIIHDGKRYW